MHDPEARLFGFEFRAAKPSNVTACGIHKAHFTLRQFVVVILRRLNDSNSPLRIMLAFERPRSRCRVYSCNDALDYHGVDCHTSQPCLVWQAGNDASDLRANPFGICTYRGSSQQNRLTVLEHVSKEHPAVAGIEADR